MTRPSRNADRLAALGGGGGASDSVDPPSSAWGVVAVSADEDAGFDDELIVYVVDGDEWPGQWGSARLGIP